MAERIRIIEAACRNLVKDRMDLSGARWSLTGAEAVHRLRSLRASHDFDDYRRFHEARERASQHDVRYDGAIVPPRLAVPPRQPVRPDLRVLQGGR